MGFKALSDREIRAILRDDRYVKGYWNPSISMSTSRNGYRVSDFAFGMRDLAERIVRHYEYASTVQNDKPRNISTWELNNFEREMGSKLDLGDLQPPESSEPYDTDGLEVQRSRRTRAIGAESVDEAALVAVADDARRDITAKFIGEY